jgi:transcriptional regulator with XRE-family HTH domain
MSRARKVVLCSRCRRRDRRAAGADHVLVAVPARVTALLDGLSILEVAKRAGLPERTAYAVLRGEQRIPGFDAAWRLGRAMGCSLDDLAAALEVARELRRERQAAKARLRAVVGE